MQEYKFDGKWENLKYKFSAFEGLQSRLGSYTSKDKSVLSDGTVKMNITAALDHTEPTMEQVQTINWISNNGKQIKEAIYKAVKKYYVEVKQLYGYDAEDPDHKKWFPNLNSVYDLGKAMGVGNITIMLAVKDSLCAYNLECGCTWDEEHGLGIEMYKDEVLNIGDAASCIGSGPLKLTPFNENKIDKKVAIAKHKEWMKIWESNPNDSRIRIDEPEFYTVKHPIYNKLNPSQEEANKMYSKSLIRGGYIEKFKSGIRLKNIRPTEELLKFAINNCRVNISNEILMNKPELKVTINNVNNQGLTVLDKLYNKLASNHLFNKEYLNQIDKQIEWLKVNGGKLGNDL